MMLHDLMRFALDRQHELWLATRTHIALSLGAVAIAALIGVPLGVWTSRHDAGRPVVGFVSALRVIPSLAILALVLP
ncbi:MAG: ABC transporter permease, partial [Candidatus Eremiobacteraeota bacterium]|nr:ABC transporter permease [Candidatus Eremiobacteraeota bacterium]